MDMQYISVRYEKGRSWTADFLKTTHRIESIPLSHAHADLLQYQRSDDGGNGLLSSYLPSVS